MSEFKFTEDDLAQEIRRIDGNHNLGAGLLSEKLFEFIEGKHPAPAESDNEVVRNEFRAYAKGWIACAKWANREDLISDQDSPAYIRDRDDALKSQPAQPCDTEALEWLLTKVSGADLCRAGVKEFSKEAVKEAMNADREGK